MWAFIIISVIMAFVAIHRYAKVEACRDFGGKWTIGGNCVFSTGTKINCYSKYENMGDTEAIFVMQCGVCLADYGGTDFTTPMPKIEIPVVKLQ